MKNSTGQLSLWSVRSTYGYWAILGISVMLVLLLTHCRSNSAREILDAEVKSLPLPPGSIVLARNDRLGGGQIPECAGVVTELLLGNSMSAEDIYRFYAKELVARGWQIKLQIDSGIVLQKDERTGISLSEDYYTSTVAPHNKIKQWEQQFRSLTYINIGRSFYDPFECERALDKRLKRGP